MVKTTIYLPEELKRAIEAEASARGRSEADVIRDALRTGLPKAAARPRGGIFAGEEPIADRADDLLRGFGE